MTVYCLEARNTQNWQDVRYRAYTTSAKRAAAFERIPKIKFTDSGHGIVFTQHEHARGMRREPNVRVLEEYIREHMRGR